MSELHATFGELVNVGTGIPGISITTKMVGSQSIDGDDDDIRRI